MFNLKIDTQKKWFIRGCRDRSATAVVAGVLRRIAERLDEGFTSEGDMDDESDVSWSLSHDEGEK